MLRLTALHRSLHKSTEPNPTGNELAKPHPAKRIEQDFRNGNLWHWHYELPGLLGHKASGTCSTAANAEQALNEASAAGDRHYVEQLKKLGLLPEAPQ
jgi:hypothetical protein